MARVTIEGVTLETALIPGAADRPWLVFLHEGLGSVSMWRDFPDRVASRIGAPALIYARRGYGHSDALAGPREPDFMHVEALDVLPKLLAHFGIANALLIGHSDGASIALIHASTYPARLAGTVLMAPHVMVENLSRLSIARVRESYLAGGDSGLKGRLARHHAHVDDAFLGWADIWLDPRFRVWSLLPECRKLAVPTLLIQGEDDEYGTLAQIDTIEAAAPGPITRLVLANCGHSPQRDQEAAVTEAIAAFWTNQDIPHGVRASSP